MSDAPFIALQEELAERAAAGLTRTRRVVASPQQPRLEIEGRTLLSFCSNDYLGLANHPELIAALQHGASTAGVGSGASHLITGHHALHHALEERLAAFVDKPRAVLFSTGYMANIGIVSALMRRGDALFSDRLNHASLNDAALLARAAFRRYPHHDLAALDALLATSRAPRKLVVTDAVFSMDGDIAPVPELLALCERHDAWLVLDDAHGFGVLGSTGRGILEHFGIVSPRIITMATLGKAAGVAGAFVAGEPEVAETLIQRARTYGYTTAAPPALSAALLAALPLIAREDWRRVRLRQWVSILRDGLSGCRWRLMTSETPIQPLVIGDHREALRVAAWLEARGILVPAIRPPTVPQGTARLRISLSAAHDATDVIALVDALRAAEQVL